MSARAVGVKVSAAATSARLIAKVFTGASPICAHGPALNIRRGHAEQYKRAVTLNRPTGKKLRLSRSRHPAAAKLSRKRYGRDTKDGGFHGRTNPIRRLSGAR